MMCQSDPRAQSDLQIDYKSIIEKTVESRAQAGITVENEKALTGDGYVQIGTIRATQLGAKVDPTVTDNLRDFILREAARNGGDLVLFGNQGVIGQRSTETIVSVCNPLDAVWKLIGHIEIGGKCDEATTDYVGTTKKQMAIVSEGTVWRRDPDLTAYLARVPERDHFFRLIQNGDKLVTIEEALSHDPGLATIRDKNGATPLHYAAAGNEADVVKVLLTYHADVNAVDSRNWTPLDEAGWAQAKDVIRILRENDGHF